MRARRNSGSRGSALGAALASLVLIVIAILLGRRTGATPALTVAVMAVGVTMGAVSALTPSDRARLFSTLAAVFAGAAIVRLVVGAEVVPVWFGSALAGIALAVALGLSPPNQTR